MWGCKPLAGSNPALSVPAESFPPSVHVTIFATMRLPFRSSRFAALVLLLASPGITGLAVDAAHPCPEKAPWTVESSPEVSHQDGSGHGAGNHGSDPASQHPQGESHDCHCIGACQSAPAARSVDLDRILVLVEPLQVQVLRPHITAFIPVGPPADRLPPATAPPLA